MLGQIFTSLRDSGLLPVAASLFAVVIASLVLSRQKQSSSVASSRLRELDNLRDGNSGARYRAGSMRRVAEDEAEEEGSPLVNAVLASLSGLGAELPLLGAKDREKVRDLLARAGVRREDALGLFIGAKLAAIALGALIAWGGIAWLGLFSGAGTLKIAAVLVGAIVGSLAPEFVLKHKAAGRRAEIVRNLPDALDLMVICTEAGLSLDPTIERVARELRLSAAELAREIGLMSHEMRLLPKREMALENFMKRNDYKEVRSLMSTLIQTLRYGTSLAHSLRVLAAESRNARMLAVEEKAARLPAMMSIPLICFMLPAVFLVIGGPAIAQIMKNFF
ncbi:MAG: type II secretion system F family protein [Alphaproteobacteria bacterium]